MSNTPAAIAAPSPARTESDSAETASLREREFKDGDQLVTDLIWEVDRAVKQAARENGRYDTTIRHILNRHLAALPDRDGVIEECAQVAEDHTPNKQEMTLAAHVTGRRITDAIRSLKSGSAS